MSYKQFSVTKQKRHEIPDLRVPDLAVIMDPARVVLSWDETAPR
jgi:hypothetical protein